MLYDVTTLYLFLIYLFLADLVNKIVLDWKKRLNIIEGIARRILYLHRDSKLRIMHRDLKASNILLDGEMTPKISDFRMARIFEAVKMRQIQERLLEHSKCTFNLIFPR